MRNFIGTIAEKVKNHYRKSGMIDAGGKIKNPLKVKIFIVCMLALPLLQFCIFTIYVNIDGMAKNKWAYIFILPLMIGALGFC